MLKYGRHINLCGSLKHTDEENGGETQKETQKENKSENKGEEETGSNESIIKEGEKVMTEQIDIGNIYYNNIYNFFKINQKNFNKIGIKNTPSTIQIFIDNPLNLGNKDISKLINIDNIKKIRSFVRKNNINLFVHSSYLTRLTYENSNKSISSLLGELKSAYLLMSKGVVVHCGSKRTKGGVIIKKKEALDNLIKNASEVINKFCTMLISNLLKNKSGNSLIINKDQIINNTKNINKINDIFESKINNIKLPKLLFEISAGSGLEIGKKIKDLIYIIDGIKKNICNYSNRKRKLCENMFGICLDTCHMFQYGYNLSTKKGVDSVFSEFGEYTKYINLIHLNDTAYPIGQHKDVHQSIGCGYITKKNKGSFDGFRELLSEAINNNISIILETQSRNCDNNLLIAENLARNSKFDSELLVVYLLTTKNNKLLYKNIDYC